jgi:thiol-disulfide isomerase/thioredoxin
MNKIKLILLFIVLYFSKLAAQHGIDFHFPQAANEPCCLVLLRGMKIDTTDVGKFDGAGKCRLAVSAEDADFCGVGKLLFTSNKTLPPVNLIVCGEEGIEVENLENPQFKNSPENEAFSDFMQRQNDLFRRFSETFQSSSVMLADAKKREVEQEYEKLNAEIAASPLYAARLHEIFNYLLFYGSSFSQTDDEVRAEQEEFITNKLNFKDLYNSGAGYWTPFFDSWHEKNMNESDSLFVTDARKMLGRTTETDVHLALSQAIINVLAKYSRREYLLPQIFSDINYPILGQPAPAIINGTDTIFPKSALIMFYASDCGNCRAELYNLIEKYPLLRDNQIRVITIAADSDKEMFEDTAQKMLWQDNICDFKGFDGQNFVNYGVVGTPTFILIDKEGIVRGRYAQMKEIVK